MSLSDLISADIDLLIWDNMFELKEVDVMSIVLHSIQNHSNHLCVVWLVANISQIFLV